ncbi:MAG: M48 family metallopeptidase [Proteobacteria bacterium]|nr:M48 family metallopeptidase [Pseudomonadota bacterium]MBU1061090.1 M48 family metallopeptidase [Pseudomonadota bacterium]
MMVADIAVLVWRKPVKNLNLTVYGPDGRVRLSVPLFTSDKRVRQVVMARMGWIRKQQARFRKLPAPVELQMVSGERHSLFGRACFLEVIEGSGLQHVSLGSDDRIRLHVRRGVTSVKRLQLLHEWYRLQLKARIPDLLEYWQPRVQKRVIEWYIKKMKTRWGTCNITKNRIWLNLELAKKPEECLEYILVHEMVHLLERCHNEQFYAHMDRLLPHWRNVDQLLKQE